MSVSEAGAAAELRDALGRRVRHVLELAASETELAALSGLGMLLLVIVAAASVVIAWGLLVASLLYAVAATGVSWPLAAVAFAVLHAVIAFVCWELTVKLSRNLTLPALRKAVMQAGADHDDDKEGRRGTDPLADG